MTHPEKLKAIVTRRKESKHAERICSELTYLDALSALRGGTYDKQLEQAADLLLARIADDGVITAHAVAETESALSDLAPAAKSLKEIFVAHAHIDMNWQWGYNETAAITVDTFRTMLALMREYPDFTFAQSQASTYEIIEKYRPDAMAIEELFFNTNVTTGIRVAEARGVILLAARQAGIEIQEYTPLQVKQAVVGYGRAEKKQVITMVTMLLGLAKPPKPDDTADALAIAICHAHSGGSRLANYFNK